MGSGTWKGASGAQWATTSNWSGLTDSYAPGFTPGFYADDALFQAVGAPSTPYTITITKAGGTITLGALRFNDTFQTSLTLSYSGGGTIQTGTVSVNLATSTSGTRTLELSDNTYFRQLSVTGPSFYLQSYVIGPRTIVHLRGGAHLEGGSEV